MVTIGIISNALNIQYCPLAEEFMFNPDPNAVFYLIHTNKLTRYCYTVEVLTKNKQPPKINQKAAQICNLRQLGG